MEGLPLCIISSNEVAQSKKLLGAITEKDNFTSTNGTIVYPWSFETKYYTCTVRFEATQHCALTDSLSKTVEAFLIMFTPEQVEDWNAAMSCWNKMKHCEPPVRLLVCDSCDENSKVKRLEIQKWCIDNEFELIELDTCEDDEADQDDFDVDGVKRIHQVLHAHTWSNLTMKDNPDTTSPYMKQLMEEARLESHSLQSNDDGASSAPNGTDVFREHGMSAEELARAFHDEGEVGVESFEKLFSKLHLMKQQAEGLSPDQRKLYAEQVAMSFWNALGDSDDDSD